MAQNRKRSKKPQNTGNSQKVTNKNGTSFPEKEPKAKGWRKKLKLHLIALHGGKCSICGYDRCSDALEFHHIDARNKNFSIGSANPKHTTWDEVCEEAEKCIVVCSNCHRELHSDLIHKGKKNQNYEQ